MSGIRQFNIPAFDAAAAHLREQGFNIISPAELDSPEMRRQAMESEDGDLSKLEKGTGETWGDVLARDVKIVADKVDGLIFLPGWANSRGALLESFVGIITGKFFYTYDTLDGAKLIPKRFVVEALVASEKLK